MCRYHLDSGDGEWIEHHESPDAKREIDEHEEGEIPRHSETTITQKVSTIASGCVKAHNNAEMGLLDVGMEPRLEECAKAGLLPLGDRHCCSIVKAERVRSCRVFQEKYGVLLQNQVGVPVEVAPNALKGPNRLNFRAHAGGINPENNAGNYPENNGRALISRKN